MLDTWCRKKVVFFGRFPSKDENKSWPMMMTMIVFFSQAGEGKAESIQKLLKTSATGLSKSGIQFPLPFPIFLF